MLGLPQFLFALAFTAQNAGGTLFQIDVVYLSNGME